MYRYEIFLNDIPSYLLDMPLIEMRCKHVFNPGIKEDTVLLESNRIGYKWCEWGRYSGHEKNFKYHMGVIHRMEKDDYFHAVRIVVCAYDFSVEKYIWVDNLHSAIRYMRKYGVNVLLRQIPFYVVDITQPIVRIFAYSEYLRTTREDIQGAIDCAYKRKERSDSEVLINADYRLLDFVKTNPMFLMVMDEEK